MSLIDDTLNKVKNSALSKAKSTVVGKLNKVTNGAFNGLMGETNKLSGTVIEEGSVESSQRFLMYQTHTNRPKYSHQFYVLFHPRTDLTFPNVKAGTPGQPSGLISDLKAWGKRQLDSAGTWLKTTFTGDDSIVPDWMKSIGQTAEEGADWVKQKVGQAYLAAKGLYNDVSAFAKSVKEDINDLKKYVFGVKGTPDEPYLYQPAEYKAIESGWLSSFCQSVQPRAEIIEFGLFGEEDSQTFLQKMCDEISMHVVDTDRPSWNLPVTRYNQYNRDRLVYEKVKYEPVTMTFYDTIDSALLKILLFQLAFINDSYLKEFRHFQEYTQLENFVNNPGNWGMNLYSNTGIFNAISILEVYGDQCTVYNLEMPKITKVSLSKADATKTDVHKITVTFEYEGLTNINPINLESGGYDIMLAWSMGDEQKASEICRKIRMKYDNSLQGIANLSKDFFVKGGNITERLKDLGNSMGLGSEIKLASEIHNALNTGNLGSLTKQLVNPSSITSKIGRLF